MIRKTAALAVLLVAAALPALADCPGHQVKPDQSAQTQTEKPVVPVVTSS